MQPEIAVKKKKSGAIWKLAVCSAQWLVFGKHTFIQVEKARRTFGCYLYFLVVPFIRQFSQARPNINMQVKAWLMQQQENTKIKMSAGAQISLVCPTKSHFPFHAVWCCFQILLAISSGLNMIRTAALEHNALVYWTRRPVVSCCYTEWLTHHQLTSYFSRCSAVDK